MRLILIDNHSGYIFGDTDADPIATVYDDDTALRIAALPDMMRALGTALGLITKHGLAVQLADGHPHDYARLEEARTVFNDAYRLAPARAAEIADEIVAKADGGFA